MPYRSLAGRGGATGRPPLSGGKSNARVICMPRSWLKGTGRSDVTGRCAAVQGEDRRRGTVLSVAPVCEKPGNSPGSGTRSPTGGGRSGLGETAPVGNRTRERIRLFAVIRFRPESRRKLPSRGVCGSADAEMFGAEIFRIGPCSLASHAGSVPRRLVYTAGLDDKETVVHVLRGESKKFIGGDDAAGDALVPNPRKLGGAAVEAAAAAAAAAAAEADDAAGDALVPTLQTRRLTCS